MASKAVQALAQRQQQKRQQQKAGSRRRMPVQERKALWAIRREADKLGSKLQRDPETGSRGRGGLPSTLVLGVMRRDEYRCKVCGELGSDENGGIGIHHKYQHIQEPEAREKGERANAQGRRNDPAQITTICAKCHDAVHERDRAENPGEPDADQAQE